MSTLRLENEAEANDDYDYLSLAEQLVESKPDHPEYRDRLNSIIQMVIEPGNVEYTDPELTNSANLTRARSLLAAFIEGRFGNIKEVTNDGINNTFTSTADGVPVIKDWHNRNIVLCFDVCETNTYQKSKSERTAKISLVTSEWQRLNQHVTIDFESKTIMDCAGAALVPKGTGWYTVQIPLKNVDLNVDPNEAKGPAKGDETLSMVFFDQRYVNQSFLVDNFRLETAVGNGDLNGDGKPDKKDVTEFGDYIMKNGAPPQNAWEADLDHNGVHDARDMSRLKRMIMEQ